MFTFFRECTMFIFLIVAVSSYFNSLCPRHSSRCLQETYAFSVVVRICSKVRPDRAVVVVSIITPSPLPCLPSSPSFSFQPATGQPCEAQANPQAAPSHFPRLYLANASNKPRQLQVPINSHASPLVWQLESFPIRRHRQFESQV
jgi:hypothetical protein